MSLLRILRSSPFLSIIKSQRHLSTASGTTTPVGQGLTLNYCNGKWLAQSDLKISPFDITFLRGFGAFDFLRTYDRRPFLLNEHLDRFLFTIKQMEMEFPHSKKDLENLVYEGIGKHPDLHDFYIKFFYTGGLGVDAITQDPATATFIMMFLPAVIRKGEIHPSKLITYDYERYLARSKSLNYMAAVSSLKQARSKGAYDALYIDRNQRILECTTQNFFAVRDGVLITPKDDVLFGMTRDFILRMAKLENIPYKEQEIFKQEIPEFTEAFTTSTTKEVSPVVQIDDQVIGSGAPGPISRRLYQAFMKNKAKY